jgi:hypothetical protein
MMLSLHSSTRHIVIAGLISLAVSLGSLRILRAQSPQTASFSDDRLVAIVPLDDSLPDHALEVTGALQVHDGRAYVNASATIRSGSQATHVTLPYRGTMFVCAYSMINLAADTSVPSGQVPGLLLAMDHGAVEMSFATTRNSDALLTPDFRILISGPGASELKVRLGPGGDTCVDNPGANAPYILVTSIFDGGNYRVQPGQRVMFQHGSLHEVVDQEPESCGCPPAQTGANDFPVAQSEGLAPMSKPAPAPEASTSVPPVPVPPLVYNGKDHDAASVPAPQSATAAATPPAPPTKAQKKPRILTRVGRFFRKVFGAD